MPDRYILLGASPNVAASLNEAPLALPGWGETETDGATVAVTPAGAVVTVPDSVAVCYAHTTRSHTGGRVLDLRARLEFVGTTNANVIGYLALVYGSHWLFIRCRGDGRVDIKHNFGGDTALANVTGRPVDGTGWVRLRVKDDAIVCDYGTGSGSAEPTTWTNLHTGTLVNILSLTPDSIRVQGGTEGGALGSQTTFAVRGLSVRSGQV